MFHCDIAYFLLIKEDNEELVCSFILLKFHTDTIVANLQPCHQSIDRRSIGSQITVLIGGFSQPFDITLGRQAKQPFVFTVELCGVAIAHLVSCAGCVEGFAEHESAGLLKL